MLHHLCKFLPFWVRKKHFPIKAHFFKFVNLYFESLERREVPALLSYTGGNYVQNFDGLPTSTTGNLDNAGPYFLDSNPGGGQQNLNFGMTGWQSYDRLNLHPVF